MDFSKPKVTIDLDEYNHLIKETLTPELSELELQVAAFCLHGIQGQQLSLFNRPPAEGINLPTPIGTFIAVPYFYEIEPNKQIRLFKIIRKI